MSIRDGLVLDHLYVAIPEVDFETLSQLLGGRPGIVRNAIKSGNDAWKASTREVGPAPTSSSCAADATAGLASPSVPPMGTISTFAASATSSQIWHGRVGHGFGRTAHLGSTGSRSATTSTSRRLASTPG